MSTPFEQAVAAGVATVNEWIESDPRGYIKASEEELVTRILKAAAPIIHVAAYERGYTVADNGGDPNPHEELP
jgi:hypothetical protein